MRWLFLTHRYLGIALGLLMVMWCLSGIVMIYVRYPELPQARRLGALQPIDWRGCCTTGDALDPNRPVTGLVMEMLAGRPVARVAQSGRPSQSVDLRSGTAIGRIGADQATTVALAYGAHPGIPDLIDHDQWTVSGEFRKDRPLYRLAYDDAAGTRLYVSGTTGEAVQITTRSQRFWNWLGAVPHWLYFTRLRADAALWSQVVIWTSLSGCFLTGTGLYIGVRRFLRRRGMRWSPYHGFMVWHHLPGLVFGVFTLSWVASGLISMNPWGFLDSAGAAQEVAELRGPPPSTADVNTALQTLAAAAPPSVVQVATAPYDGELAFIATASDGKRQRIDASGKALPPPDLDRATDILHSGPAVLLTVGDAYYFDSRSETARLPVYRIILNDAGHTRIYLDPISGEIVKTADSAGRWYRWLHEGLHRLDFEQTLRARPLWDIVIVSLMLGVTFVCGTGAYLGLRRLLSKRRFSDTEML